MLVFLFINKIDVLVEKIVRGWDILELIEKYLDVFLDFEIFMLIGRYIYLKCFF